MLRRYMYSILAVAFIVGFVTLLRAHRHPGTEYAGLTTREWESELKKWEIVYPRCSTGGDGAWVVRRPSIFSNVLDSFGVRMNLADSSCPLVSSDPKALPVLMELLESKDSNCRRIALVGIKRIGEPARPAVPLLVRTLDDPDEEVAIAAALTLERWDRERAMKWFSREK